MTTTIAGIDNALTSVAAIRDRSRQSPTSPPPRRWYGATDPKTNGRLTTHLVDKGTFRGLTRKPNSFWCVRPRRRGTRGGPHVHLLGAARRRWAHQ
jgi:hypothetical protein